MRAFLLAPAVFLAAGCVVTGTGKRTSSGDGGTCASSASSEACVTCCSKQEGNTGQQFYGDEDGNPVCECFGPDVGDTFGS